MTSPLQMETRRFIAISASVSFQANTLKPSFRQFYFNALFQIRVNPRFLFTPSPGVANRFYLPITFPGAVLAHPFGYPRSGRAIIRRDFCNSAFAIFRRQFPQIQALALLVQAVKQFPVLFSSFLCFFVLYHIITQSNRRKHYFSASP